MLQTPQVTGDVEAALGPVKSWAPRQMLAAVPFLTAFMDDMLPAAVRTGAVMLLADLAAADFTVGSIVGERAMPFMTSLIGDAANPEGRLQAARLAACVQNPWNMGKWEKQLAAPAVKAVVAMLQDAATAEGKAQAAAALTNLQHQGSSLWMARAAAAALPHLLNILQDPTAREARAEAATAIASFADQYVHHASSLRKKGKDTVVKLAEQLRNPSDVEGRVLAATALDQLMFTYQEYLTEEEAAAVIQALVSALLDTTFVEEGGGGAIRAIHGLAYEQRLKEAIANSDAISALASLMTIRTIPVRDRRYVPQALARLTAMRWPNTPQAGVARARIMQQCLDKGMPKLAAIHVAGHVKNECSVSLT